MGVSARQFDDMSPWEIEVLVGGYLRQREDAERCALAQAHKLATWVWAAFANKLPDFDDVVPRQRPFIVESPDARTALAEARWTDWWASRRARRGAEDQA